MGLIVSLLSGGAAGEPERNGEREEQSGAAAGPEADPGGADGPHTAERHQEQPGHLLEGVLSR